MNEPAALTLVGRNRAKRAQSGLETVNGPATMRGARCVGNPTVPVRPRLATIEQAATYLGLGSAERPAVRSVWRLIEQGVLTPVRLPGLRRTWLEWAQLDALIDGAVVEGRP